MSNKGNRNTGNSNTGNSNTGNRNTGNRNTGNWNTGSRNTGSINTGSINTGNRNTGNWNTGSWNTGNWNTGNWNTCDKETGFFNTEKYKTIRVFNSECNLEEWDNATMPSFLYFDQTVFIEESQMTIDEKASNPKYVTTGGYLKVYSYKEAFKKSWENASEEDRELLYKLPNFRADVFFEISGIDVNQKTKELTVSEIEKLLGHKIKIIK